jgi:hypothetical protein
MGGRAKYERREINEKQLYILTRVIESAAEQIVHCLFHPQPLGNL